MTQMSQIETQATETLTLYTVQALRSDDGEGNQEWAIAARRQQPGQPRKMTYGAAIDISEQEAVSLVDSLEREGCPARMVTGRFEHPLRAAVNKAEADLRLARDAFEALDAELSGEDTYQETEAAAEAVRKAEGDLELAQAALDGSDCPRQWELREEGFAYDTITAASAEDALAIARDNCDRSNYPESTGTLYIDVRVSCEETGEDASETVTLEAPEPDCERGETHDWQSPHSLVGGLTENPGVHGSGGGVLITEVCRHCGCKRVTDTWAQNPSTGEQGLESVEYEENAFTAEELAEAFGEDE